MATLIAALIGSISTVVLGFFAFDYQQRWNKKLSFYEEIIENLTNISSIVREIRSDAEDALSKNEHSLPDKNKFIKIDDGLRKISSRMPIYKLVLSRDTTTAISDLTRLIVRNKSDADNKIENKNHTENEIDILEEIQDRYETLTSEIHHFTCDLISHAKSDLDTTKKAKGYCMYIKEKTKKLYRPADN